MATSALKWLDPLYGDISLSGNVVDLTGAPIVQRMRHVRLSNIDSLDLPSIASLTRYEHVLGVCFLAQNVPYRASLSDKELIAFDAAALLHDWAITAYGHLVEEALQFAEANFDHETRLSQQVAGDAEGDTGGLAYHQVLHGRDSGLFNWAERLRGSHDFGQEIVRKISSYVVGDGSCGKIIAGSIDIDNIDNVYRVAYHLGLDANYNDPLSLARSIVGVDKRTNFPIFSSGSDELIARWVDLRYRVYSRLMLSERDFAGKLMMLYSTLHAYREGVLTTSDWHLTDDEYKQKLVNRENPEEVRGAAIRWSLGDLWSMSPMFWVSGSRPRFADLANFSDVLSEQTGRVCFCYGIKDKRQRQLDVMFDDGSRQSFGEEADRWLFAFGSPKRTEISMQDVEDALRALEAQFNVRILGRVHNREASMKEPAWLI